MVNEIKGLQNTTVKNPAVGNNQQTTQTENQVKPNDSKENLSASSPAQEVNLTDTASKLRQLEAKIASQPVVDTQRVESIKKSIADGTFKVDTTRTAEKMAEFESLLASKVGDK